MRQQRVVGRIYGMKYSWKGHKDRNRHNNRIKRSGEARLVYIKNINHNIIPTTWRWASEDQSNKLSCWPWCGTASTVPVGSPSHGGDVTVYVWHKPPELAHSFLVCSCVYFCLYGPFNCISFHKFSRHLAAFLLYSFGLISASSVPSAIDLFYESLPQPWYNPLWLTGLEPSTN